MFSYTFYAFSPSLQMDYHTERRRADTTIILYVLIVTVAYRQGAEMYMFVIEW
jgi:hypothetical protein